MFLTIMNKIHGRIENITKPSYDIEFFCGDSCVHLEDSANSACTVSDPFVSIERIKYFGTNSYPNNTTPTWYYDHDYV